MKIQCDVCNKDEALLFCTADDAALCSACDHRVHHANILASKHLRFPLIHPINNHFPLCDICQERRAFLFCLQDRAILCRDCDFPIHSANELTQKHDRFLLTGVKLSCVSAMDVPSSSSSEACISEPLFQNTANVSSAPVSHSPSIAESSTSNAPMAAEALPGWHFEEFLESTSAAGHPFGFCKLQSDDVGGDWIFPFVDAVVELERSSDRPSSEDWGIWSPEEAAVPLFCSGISCEVEMEERKEGRIEKGGGEGGDGGGGGWSRKDDVITVPDVNRWPIRLRSS